MSTSSSPWGIPLRPHLSRGLVALTQKKMRKQKKIHEKEHGRNVSYLNQVWVSEGRRHSLVASELDPSKGKAARGSVSLPAPSPIACSFLLRRVPEILKQ